MKEKLKKVLDLFIIPAFPEVVGYDIKIRKLQDIRGKDVKLFQVNYVMKKALSNEKEEMLGDDTWSLFVMLSPKDDEKIDYTFAYDLS